MALSPEAPVCNPRPQFLFSFAMALLALTPAASSAQVFEATGERALGMGGAFVAVADDATATYWNPAGLATGRTIDACLSRSSVDALVGPDALGNASAAGGTATTFCVAMPAFGFSVHSVRVLDGGRPISPTGSAPGDRQDPRRRVVGVSSLATRQFGATVLQTVLPALVVGATLKYVRGTAAGTQVPVSAPRDLLDAASSLRGRESAVFDADLGAMLSAGALRAGVTVRNLRAPGFDADDGSRLVLQRQVRVGVAVTPGRDALSHASRDGWIVALDVDATRTAAAAGDRRMVALGAERWLAGHRLGLRAGGRANTVGRSRPAATAGISLGLTPSLLLEAHVVRGGQDADRGWGIGVRTGY
jgi:hypothetical protein